MVEVDESIVRVHEDRLQFVLIVKEVGRCVVCCTDGSEVLDIPIFGIGDAHVTCQGVVPLCVYNMHRQCHKAVASKNHTTVSVGLFWKAFTLFYKHLLIAGQQSHIGNRGKISGAKKGWLHGLYIPQIMERRSF